VINFVSVELFYIHKKIYVVKILYSLLLFLTVAQMFGLGGYSGTKIGFLQWKIIGFL